jgi:hypothetical protein
MSAPTLRSLTDDIERARQEYLQDTDVSPTVSPADNTPGGFGCHELLDRTNLLSEQLQDWLLSHPACYQNPEWFALAYQAFTTLHDLYQKVGAEHLSANDAGKNRSVDQPA